MTLKQRLKRIGFKRSYFYSVSVRMKTGEIVNHAGIADTRSIFAKSATVLWDVLDTHGEIEGATAVEINRLNRI